MVPKIWCATDGQMDGKSDIEVGALPKNNLENNLQRNLRKDKDRQWIFRALGGTNFENVPT